MELYHAAKTDRTRARMFALGLFVGVMTIGSSMGAMAYVGYGADPVEKAKKDEVIAVALEKPPEPEPEPEPEPTPPPKVNPNPAPAGRFRPGPKVEVQAPDANSDVKETDAKRDDVDTGDDRLRDRGGGTPGGTGTGFGSTDGTGTGAGEPAQPEPPKEPPKREKKKLMRVTENVTPPAPVSQPFPSYPESAKAAGVEGTVVVRYIVTESGEVTGVKAMRGPPELMAVCEAAVRSWRFKPALFEGAPVAVIRFARFPFRIKT